MRHVHHIYSVETALKQRRNGRLISNQCRVLAISRSHLFYDVLYSVTLKGLHNFARALCLLNMWTFFICYFSFYCKRFTNGHDLWNNNNIIILLGISLWTKIEKFWIKINQINCVKCPYSKNSFDSIASVIEQLFCDSQTYFVATFLQCVFDNSAKHIDWNLAIWNVKGSDRRFAILQIVMQLWIMKWCRLRSTHEAM